MMTLASKFVLALTPVIVSFYAVKWNGLDKDVVFIHRSPRILKFPVPMEPEYDFIIAGGGTAGLILANKLSEKFSVLVLEAGGHPQPLVSVPGIAVPLSELPYINFLHRSTPQKNAARENEGIIPITAGKMLGGGSSHNYMVWERGNRGDYARWAELTRDPSFKYESILKYLIKIEKLRTLDSNYGHDHTHVDPPQSFLSVGQAAWFEAGRELGYNIRDPRKHQTIGFNPIIYSTSRGKRASSYTLYLQPILHQKWRKLTILQYAFVTKVILKGNTAIGVEYRRHGVTRLAFASKEVIVSAGTVWSPIILFRSGIGPESQVHAAKAEHHVMELPVGRNLQDHPVVPIQPIYVGDPSLAWSLERNLTFKDILEFTTFGVGALTTPYHGSEAFIHSSQWTKRKNKHHSSCDNPNCWPDLQIYFNPTGLEPNSVTCAVSNGRPVSRGVLTLNTSAVSIDDDYLSLLDYKHFSEPRDFEVTMAGINFCMAVIEKTKAFHKIGAYLSTEPYEPCRHHVFRSREYWKCYIQHKTTTGYHTSGTCHMGYGKGDPQAVVDPKFKVIGIERLRVVDSSVIPQITNANIMAPTMVLAEKAGDDILQEHLSLLSK